MEILVLGGSGFIGSHVVDELLSKGHTIRIFGRSPEKYRPPILEIKYYVGNFTDTSLLAEALHGVDAVIHLISTNVPSTSNLDPVADIQNNLENSVRLFQLMVKMNVRRILFLSSGGTVYGVPSSLPVTESHQLDPICSYGIVKVAIEKYLGMFQRLYGLQPIILRPSNPYGPRQGHQGVQGAIATFMYKIICGEKITIWGDGSVVRDYIYISDLAKLCRICIESDKCGTYNAGSGTGSTLLEILDYLQILIKKEAIVEYKTERSFDVDKIVLDVKKTSRTFNWLPESLLKEGLSSYSSWMIRNI